MPLFFLDDSQNFPSLPDSLQQVTHIAVGSKNVPKLHAVQDALNAYLPNRIVQGFDVASGVSEQPVGFREIVQGAETRALAAWHALRRKDLQARILGVGIEDGLVELPDLELGYLNIGCAVITDGVRQGHGFSSLFSYPTSCWREAVARHEPIGGLFDAFWNAKYPRADSRAPSALSVGNIGKLSLGVLPRAEYARHAVLCSLIHFLHPDFFATAPSHDGETK